MRRLAGALAPLALALAFLSSCSDGSGGTEEASPEAALAELNRTMLDYRTRMDHLLGLRWFPRRNVYGKLLKRRADVDAWIQQAARDDVGPQEVAEHLERGRELAADLDAQIRPILDTAEQLVALGTNIDTLHRGFLQHLESAGVDRETYFPLRNRYQDGWLPEKDQWLKDLDTAIHAGMQGEGPQRFQIVRRNLLRCYEKGQELLEELSRLTRELRVVPARIEGLARLAAFADQLLEHELSDETRRLLVAARDAARAGLAEIRSTWERVRAGLISEEDGADRDLDALNERISELRRAILGPALPAARRLGIDPPERP